MVRPDLFAPSTPARTRTRVRVKRGKWGGCVGMIKGDLQHHFLGEHVRRVDVRFVNTGWHEWISLVNLREAE